MRRVLLTGATGFVGRHVLRTLLERGETVRAITRKPLDAAPAAVKQVTVDDLFAASGATLAEACAGTDTIIHCAWYAEPGEYLHSPRNLACLRGTLAFAEAARQAKVGRFVGIGTCFEYAMSAEPLPVAAPLDPKTPYASAKAAAFIALAGNLPPSAFAWCRLFYLFGEGEDERRFVAYVRRQLSRGEPVELTAGTQVRDFLNVAEAARQIVEIALSDFSGPANICSGRPQTIRAMAENIADEYGRRDLLRFGARPENSVDPPFVVGVPTLSEG